MYGSGGAVEWSGPESVYSPWEISIESWDDYLFRVNELTSTFHSHELVWRGMRRATWALVSSLYRRLSDVLGRPPVEDELVRAERRILDHARTDWRFDNLPALEVMGHLQHFGGPTRLIDVSENPLVALWFAVESDTDDDSHDSRLFAVAIGGFRIPLNANWGGRHLRWHALETDSQRISKGWGTGEKLKVWRPPAYNNRISAQSAGFIVDGAPVANTDAGLCRIGPGSNEVWSLSNIRETSSLNLKLSDLARAPLTAGSSTVFTYRIRAESKPEIREQLERRFGYRASAIYSDMSGFSDFLNRNSGILIK